MNGFEIRRLSPEERTLRIAQALEQLGAPDAHRAAAPLARLVESTGFAVILEAAISAVARAASPVAAAHTVEDLARRMREVRLDPGAAWTPPALEVVCTLAGASSWAGRVMGNDPALAIELAHELQQGELERTSRLDRVATRLAATPDTPTFDQRLRRLRIRQMLRIALRELRGVSVRQTGRELSDLACTCFEAALAHHRRQLEERYGKPEPPNRCVVIGMGKLGGQELNFSSDVDVLYVYEHDEGQVGDLSPHPFFVKLFERVTSSLRDVTGSGFVFRVDLDLRPEGRKGPLANSLLGLERYYETWGRTWERAAWIRASPVAGDFTLGHEVLDLLRPFVFRRSLDLEQVEALVQMKGRIDREASTRRRRGVDLKLGRGGIRELEFFVQAHQLLFGGRDARLRAPNTLDAIRGLTTAGHITSRTRDQLLAAYDQLRRVEHRVQILDDQQTHRLPADPDVRTRLARSLGYGAVDELDQAVAEPMRIVGEHFDELLGRVEDEDPTPPELRALLDDDAAWEERLEAAHALGARRPEAALAHIDAASRVRGGPLHRNAPLTARRVGERLVRDCLESPDADRALTHLPDLLRALGSHSSYVRELEQASVRRGVAQLLGTSDMLARILVHQPPLIPMVLRPSARRSRSEIESALDFALESAGDDLEAQLNALRRCRREELLRTAVADLGGELTLEAVEDRLSDLAEVILQRVVDLSLAETSERYGHLDDGGLVVVAGGALGAREMSYKSDLDLSAIYDGHGSTRDGHRAPIEASELFTRVVQRVISFLTMPLAGGELYPVDMRLRPSGSQGALVTSLGAFEAYHQTSAQLWERQALVRSRPVYGQPELRARVEAAIHRAAYEGPPPKPAEIRDMRERLAREGGRGRDLEQDLKLGPGGLIELQFVVQFWLLLFGRDHPELRTPRTRDALRALADGGFVESATAELLIRAQDRLRQAQSFRRLVGEDANLAESERTSGELGELTMSLAEARRHIRETYRRVLGAA